MIKDSTTNTAEAAEEERSPLDEFKTYCKLKALATLLGNLHRHDFSIGEKEAYGIELLLNAIGEEVYHE